MQTYINNPFRVFLFCSSEFPLASSGACTQNAGVLSVSNLDRTRAEEAEMWSCQAAPHRQAWHRLCVCLIGAGPARNLQALAAAASPCLSFARNTLHSSMLVRMLRNGLVRRANTRTTALLGLARFARSITSRPAQRLAVSLVQLSPRPWSIRNYRVCDGELRCCVTSCAQPFPSESEGPVTLLGRHGVRGQRSVWNDRHGGSDGLAPLQPDLLSQSCTSAVSRPLCRLMWGA